MGVNTEKRQKQDEGENVPAYLRIQQHFLDLIAAGDLRVGDRLPTEKEIAGDFGTSRATVQTAMSRLVYEGWIQKQAGRGTFVADAARSATIDLNDVRSFEQDADSHGSKVHYRLIRVGRELADEDVASRLGVDAGTSIFSFERLRLVGTAIIGMERRYFPPGIALDFPVEALDSESTHRLVQHFLKQEIGRMEVAIRAVAAGRDISDKIGVKANSPLLLRRHTMFSKSDDVILFGEAFYCEPFAFRYTAWSQTDI